MLKRRSFVALCASSFLFGTAFANERVPVRTASLSKPIAPTSESVAKETLKSQIAALESIVENLSSVDDYTAELTKQERVGGDLSGEQRITCKFRHASDETGAPTSIYMKWLNGDRGREVIFVEGENSDKMLVHAGGWKARILPVLALDPTGSLAMGESRHPVTEAGLLKLAQTWLDVRKQDLNRSSVTFKIEESQFDGRDGRKFTVIYGDRSESEIYRKCELWIDDERNIPLAAINYTWDTRGNEDSQTLIERYEYRDITLNNGLADIDFDRANRKYSFKN